MTENFARDATSYRAGDVISGRYRITGAIGKGGFGAVYAGEHLGTHQEVAIKMLAVDARSADPGLTERFYREARITAALSHPNTVRVFDVGEAEEGPLYLVMELLRGPTLERVLRHFEANDKRLTELQTVDVGIAVLRALSEAHQADLVHRDLKPANVILATLSGDDPLIKVLDFGLAHTEDSSITAEGHSLGTPAYMSPEQCRGDPVDPRSDLYALGVILYRCIAGRLPFDASKPLALMYMHANEAAPDLATTAPTPPSPDLCDIIMSTLAKQGAERPDSAQAMRDALEEFRRTLLLRRDSDGDEADKAAAEGTVKELIEATGPLPPLLQKRETAFAGQDAGPVTRTQVSDEPVTIQASVLPPIIPQQQGTNWLLPALLAGGLVVVGIAVWLLLAQPTPPPSAPASVAAPAAVPTPPPPAPAPAPSPTVESVVHEMAARKVEQAMAAEGAKRSRLLAEALALDPENKRLQALVKQFPEPKADVPPVVEKPPPATAKPAATPAQKRRPIRRAAKPKPKAEERRVQPAVMD